MNIYDIKVKNMQGVMQTLEAYKGKVLLIVNTATECGFTPHYADLQALYEKYAEKGLVVLDFPCDQFGHQAPGTEAEIAKFCTSRFGVTFPQFAKVEVNGENACELFKFLKKEQGFKGFDTTTDAGAFMDKMLSRADADYAQKSDIKWNFTKFLIDRNGKVIARFEPTEDMTGVAAKVAQAL
ncbi:MAG: glutathione peroxidase [Alphaproteobacteria bacterium]|nr:glutathione peroxidase [Alphaproteobacteria bacterium]